MYIKANPIKKSVYIHSAPPYLALLVGAASFNNVTVVLSHEYPDKSLVNRNYVLNDLKDKLII